MTERNVKEQSLQTSATNNSPLQTSATVDLSPALATYFERMQMQTAVSERTPKERRKHLAQANGAEKAARVIKGFWLADIQAAEGRPAMLSAATDAQIGVRTADYAVAQFNLFNQFNDLDVLDALGTIDPSKFAELRFDREEWIALAQGEQVQGMTLDVVADSTVRELKQKQREWRDEHDLKLQQERERNQQLSVELDTAQARIKALESGVEERNQRNPLPPWYRYLRNDVHTATEAMAQQLIELERLANEWVIGASRATENDESLARMAAGSVYHNLAGVVAQGQAVLKRLVQACGEEIASEDDLLLLRADDDELQHLARTRAQIIRDIEADKAARRHARETEHLNKPRGRGRPTGSKDKKPRQRREG